jgi:transposase-like protein
MVSSKMVNLAEKRKCAQVLRNERWSEEICCVYCCSQNVVRNGLRKDFIQQYVCNSCEKAFNDRTNTLFAKTQMQLNECFYLILNHSEESVNSLSKDLDRSWKTINDFIRLIKSSFLSESLEEKIEDCQNQELEVDYSKFGCGV